MSAYKKMKCSIVNKEILLESLRSLGFDPQEYAEPEALHGYMGDARTEKANIIVPKEQLNKTFSGGSNDLGFLWDENSRQYEIICSDFDSALLKIPQRIKQMYAKTAIENALKERRFHVTNVEANVQQLQRTKIKIETQKVI